jgi:hypothetical protein
MALEDTTEDELSERFARVLPDHVENGECGIPGIDVIR